MAIGVYDMTNKTRIQPVNMVGIRAFSDKYVIETDKNIHIDTITESYICINSMYTKNKETLLSVPKYVNPGDFVVFVDNNASEKHSRTVGWSNDMGKFFNKIGFVKDVDYDDNFSEVYFGNITWSIMNTCLLVINNKLQIIK